MSFSSQQRGPSSSLSEINVTPLVDVMLVLLIVFMISAPLLQSGIELDLPKGNVDMAAKENSLIVSINAEGKHFLNDQYLQPEVLLDNVRKAIAGAADKTVYIRADASVQYGSVVNLMTRLNEAGIGEFSLVTEPESKKGR